MFLKNNDQGFLSIFFINPGLVYITDHDFAKSEREREIFFLFIFKPWPSFD